MAGPLGKKVNTPTSFSPDILFPIEREQQRHRFGLDIMSGEDIWNLHEIHWLDHENKAHKNETALIINAESKFTVESKSMKLFINSFIHRFIIYTSWFIYFLSPFLIFLSRRQSVPSGYVSAHKVARGGREWFARLDVFG